MKSRKKKSNNLLPIRLVGDIILRQKSINVGEITDELLTFIEDMKFTMYETDGVGLAAPQVGSSLRLFIVDTEWTNEGAKKNAQVFINPKVIELSNDTEIENEGCLSLPEIYEKVKRPDYIVIEATDITGKIFTYKAEGFEARAIQHENDHIDGILFIDRVSKIRLIPWKRKIREIKEQTNNKGENIREVLN